MGKSLHRTRERSLGRRIRGNGILDRNLRETNEDLLASNRRNRFHRGGYHGKLVSYVGGTIPRLPSAIRGYSLPNSRNRDGWSREPNSSQVYLTRLDASVRNCVPRDKSNLTRRIERAEEDRIGFLRFVGTGNKPRWKSYPTRRLN